MRLTKMLETLVTAGVMQLEYLDLQQRVQGIEALRTYSTKISKRRVCLYKICNDRPWMLSVEAVGCKNP